MAVPWPTSLQSTVNRDTFNFDFGDTTIRSDMDIGAAKVRRRYTRGIDTATVSIYVTKAQFLDLQAFYKTDTNGGSEPFTLTNPLTDTLDTWRFTSPPNLKPNGALDFVATFNLERMP